MQIVRAKAENADELTRITFAAKRYWGYPEQWIQSWTEVLTIRLEFIDASQTYVATSAGRIFGFYALTDAGNRARLEHLWILPEAMGQGLGRKLFAHAVERARDLGYSTFEIESDPNAEGFYRRMGARRVATKSTEINGTARELPVLRYEIGCALNNE